MAEFKGIEFDETEVSSNYEALSKACKKFDENFFELGYLIYFFKETKYYRLYGVEKFEDFLYLFRLDTTVVNRLINCLKRFSERDEYGKFTCNVKKQFSKFNFSQLVEMLPLCDSDLEFITSDMSVRQIRAFKKKLRCDKKSTINKSPGVMLQEIQTELLNSFGRVCDKYPGSSFTFSDNSFSIEYENCIFDISLKVKGLK